VIRTHVIAAVCGLLVLGVMVELLRRRQLREKYAILWLGVSLVVVVLAAFPSLLNWIAHRLGISDPPNLLLFASVLVLLLVSVHLSWEASRLEEETRTLAEEVALLRMQVESLHPDIVTARPTARPRSEQTVKVPDERVGP
jgi:hypothetical protein